VERERERERERGWVGAGGQPTLFSMCDDPVRLSQATISASAAASSKIPICKVPRQNVQLSPERERERERERGKETLDAAAQSCMNVKSKGNIPL
jgi:hypothetical protein